MEIVLIKPNSPSWEYMWEWLAAHPINEGLEEPTTALNPTTNEAWQYMGSYRQNDIVISEFRHRSHPRTNDVYKVSLRHQVGDESIFKKVKI